MHRIKTIQDFQKFLLVLFSVVGPYNDIISSIIIRTLKLQTLVREGLNTEKAYQ